MGFPKDKSSVPEIIAYLKGLTEPEEIRAAMIELGADQFDLALFFGVEGDELVCLAGIVKGLPLSRLFDLRVSVEPKSMVGRAVSLGSARVGPPRGDAPIVALYEALDRALPPKMMIEPLRVGMNIKGLFLGDRGEAGLTHKEASLVRRLLAPVARLIDKLDGPFKAAPAGLALEGQAGAESPKVEQSEAQPSGPSRASDAPPSGHPAFTGETAESPRQKMSMASLFGAETAEELTSKPPQKAAPAQAPAQAPVQASAQAPSSAAARAQESMRALFGTAPPALQVSRGARPGAPGAPGAPVEGAPVQDPQPAVKIQRPKRESGGLAEIFDSTPAPQGRPSSVESFFTQAPNQPIFSGPTTTAPKAHKAAPPDHRASSSSMVHTPARTVEPLFDGEPKTRPRPSTSPPLRAQMTPPEPLFEPKGERPTPGSGAPAAQAQGREVRVGAPRVVSIGVEAASPTPRSAAPIVESPPAPEITLDPEIINAVAAVQTEEGEPRREAEMLLLQSGDEGLLALSQVFPGRLLVNRKAIPLGSVPVAQHSRVLQMMTLFGGAAAPHLERLCGHASAEVRYYAIYAFSAIRSPGCLRTLKLCLFDPSEEVRDIAVMVINRYRNGPAFDELVKGLCQLAKEGAPPQQRMAIEMLGRLRGAGGFQVLVEALRDLQCTKSAQRALRQITHQDLGDEPWRWEKWFEQRGARPRVEWLLDSLNHDHELLRRAAFEELKALIQKDYGYSPSASVRERRIAIGRWYRWWEESGRSQFRQYR